MTNSTTAQPVAAFKAVLEPTSRFAAHATLAAITAPLDTDGVLTRDDFLRILAEQRAKYPAGA